MKIDLSYDLVQTGAFTDAKSNADNYINAYLGNFNDKERKGYKFTTI